MRLATIRTPDGTTAARLDGDVLVPLAADDVGALLGARDDLVLPAVSDRVDWEVELGVVIGRAIYRASRDEAAAAIAGYTVTNDVSMRDWQNRTLQWLQGKMFERSAPVGPYLVTGDEVGDAADLEVRCEVDGAVMQQSRTSEESLGECVNQCVVSG
jgi:acylpyruvate hydrolase